MSGLTSKARDTKAHLLDCGLTLFAKKGYSATSVRDIIQLAEITQPTLYYHFTDKADLFTKLVQLHYGQTQQRLIAAIDSATSTHERLMAIAVGSFEFCNQDPRVPRLMFQTYFGPSIPEISRILKTLTKQRFHLVVGVMKNGIESEDLRSHDPDFLALAYCCLIDQPINLFSRKRNPKKFLTVELASALVKQFLCGSSDKLQFS